jgi:hypothetical protein
MKIGVIGAGHIGGTLTRRLAALGHDVAVANSRGPETLAELAKESGAKAVTIADAARGKDVVIVSIPEKNIPTLPKNLFAGLPASAVAPGVRPIASHFQLPETTRGERHRDPPARRARIRWRRCRRSRRFVATAAGKSGIWDRFRRRRRKAGAG